MSRTARLMLVLAVLFCPAAALAQDNAQPDPKKAKWAAEVAAQKAEIRGADAALREASARAMRAAKLYDQGVITKSDYKAAMMTKWAFLLDLHRKEALLGELLAQAP